MLGKAALGKTGVTPENGVNLVDVRKIDAKTNDLHRSARFLWRLASGV
jgi:hypothetical protein